MVRSYPYSLLHQLISILIAVSVDIDSVICWHVVSPYRAAYGISNVNTALIERAQTTLRQVVGSRLLQTVVTDREGLAAEIQEIVSLS